MSGDFWVGLFLMLAFVAFVGGCTTVAGGNQATQRMEACIDSGMEWRAGDCVRASQ